MNCHWKVKMHANTRLYWIRTNVSSIAASALATKLNVQMADTIMLFAVMHLWMAEIPRLELGSDFHRDGLAIRFLTNSEQISRNHFFANPSFSPSIWNRISFLYWFAFSCQIITNPHFTILRIPWTYFILYHAEKRQPSSEVAMNRHENIVQIFHKKYLVL